MDIQNTSELLEVLQEVYENCLIGQFHEDVNINEIREMINRICRQLGY